MGAAFNVCANHRRRQTRVSCAACGTPICTGCMRETPVGMKCPNCVRLPLHARGLGKPRHYILATSAGFGTAMVLGVLVVLAHLGLFGILLPILAGVLVGLAVSWGARGLHHGLFRAIAATTAVTGLVAGGLVAGSSLRFVAGPQQLFGLFLASLAAAFVAGR